MWEVYDPRSKTNQQDMFVEQLELLRPNRPENSTEVQSNSQTTNDAETWKSTQALYGNWQMTKTFNDQKGQSYPVYYNPRSEKISTQNGAIVKNVTKPSQEDIDCFYQAVQSSKTPPTEMKNGVITHKVYTNLYYDTELEIWMNKDTKSHMPGLKPPQNYPLLTPRPKENANSIQVA